MSMLKKLNKGQYIAIGVAVLSFLILYLGFDIKPKSQKALEKSRALNMEATSIENLIIEARDQIGANFSIIEALNMELKSTENDLLKVEKLKNLSGKWYEFGYPAIAGYFAQEVAEIENDAESWSIAGTTYIMGVKESDQEKTRTWSFNRAVTALETAISLDPSNLSHQINLALAFIENPPKDNPMQGVLMLRDLDTKYPDNVKVLYQLGRLSIVTNQLDNAVKRLKRAEELAPNNKNVICLLAEAYTKLGNAQEAAKYDEKCINK